MSRSLTTKLLNDLNQLKGLSYPDVGYTYYADIAGYGVYNPKVYTIINSNGGVTLSDFTDMSPKRQCSKIRQAIADQMIINGKG